jgi:hypothetical protein
MKNEMEVSIWFVKEVNKAKNQIENKITRNALSIQREVENGKSIDEIIQKIKSYACYYPEKIEKIYDVEEILKEKNVSENLIKDGIFYYHRNLRNVSSAPKIKIKSDGTVEKTTNNFEFEIKKCYTLKDLMSYFYKTNEINPNDSIVKQDEGKFRHLLKYYDVDLILFSIDVSKILRADNGQDKLKNVFELEKYIDEAEFCIKEKKNIHKQERLSFYQKRGV